MIGRTWKFLWEAVDGFLEDDALSRGAAIAFYAAMAVPPVFYIVSAIAGLAFGRVAATGAIADQVGRITGESGHQLLMAALHYTVGWGDSIWPNIIGAGLLLLTASGVFGEIEAALNAIWKSHAPPFRFWDLARSRLLSVVLVFGLGILLMASLGEAAAFQVFGHVVVGRVAIGGLLVRGASYATSFLLMALMLAAIYKVLPNKSLTWADVAFGAVVTAALLLLGEFLIAFYLGAVDLHTRYGAAGGMLVLLTSVYGSAQIFLLGAEITKVYSIHRGSHTDEKEQLRPRPGRRSQPGS